MDLQGLGGEFLKGRKLSERDKALYWQLLVGSVRWIRLLRWHLDRYLKKFSRLPHAVQAILITGAFQIIFLSRIPFFSAVDESVKQKSPPEEAILTFEIFLVVISIGYFNDEYYPKHTKQD